VNEVLTLWERACAAGPLARDDALLSDAAPTSLSARNAALVRLRARLFGPTQQLRATCPTCGALLEFSVNCESLAASLRPRAEVGAVHALRCDGYRLAYRAPDIDDWRAAAAANDFVPELMQRCIVRCERDDGTQCAALSLPIPVTEALSSAVEALEPGACVDFDLRCPECSEEWSAPMDCGAVLYGEVRARAESLLVEVDALARAYGWSEAEVLALSPTRRAAYLQLVGATG